VYLLNIVQSVMIAFLATDLVKRDRKLNSMEVVYVRSMSNFVFLIGRAIGILILFVLLNLVLLISIGVIHAIFGEPNFASLPYLIYPLIISIPSMIFVLGLTLLVMRIVRNQAVTIVIVIGYLAFILFYAVNKIFGIFDIFALVLPLISSDFVGIPDLSLLLLQRGIYFFAGIAFIILVPFFFSRLPQAHVGRKMLVLISIVFIALSTLLSIKYLNYFWAGENLRKDMRTLNKRYKNAQLITPQKCEIKFNHTGDIFDATVVITFENQSSEPIDTYLFSLNPGLKINTITHLSEDIKFIRQAHIIECLPDKPLPPGGVDSLQISYEGNINEQACYLDIRNDQIQENFHVWLYQIAKKYAFVNENYVLLTPENLWYPIAGIPNSMQFPDHARIPFLEFEMDVSTKPELTPISQGKMSVNSEHNIYEFKTEKPLPSLSLVIGNYERASLSVDSIEYSIYTFSNHDGYKEYFPDISDTLESAIRESKNDYERTLGLNYPFKKLDLIEVPIQFFAYPRIWTMASEKVLPEQVLLPELGLTIESLDFKSMKRRQERRSGRSNMTFSKQEEQVMLYRRFVTNTLTSGGFGRMDEEYAAVYFDHSLFPNYYSYLLQFYSSNIPLFNIALESYLKEKVTSQSSMFSRFSEDLTPAEKVSQLLVDNSLTTLINDTLQNEILPDVVKFKGSFLFRLLSSEMNIDEFDQFLFTTIKSNYYNSADVDDFISKVQSKFGVDFYPHIERWYTDIDIPGFIISEIEMFKIFDNDRLRYQVLFDIWNPEETTGITEVRFRTGDFRRMMQGQTAEEPPHRLIKLDPGMAKEIGVVLDEEPRMVSMDPIIARNIPLAFSKRFDEPELQQNFKPFDGERIFKDPIFTFNDNEIIIDNEDPGFNILNMKYGSVFKRMIHGSESVQKDEFQRFSFWRPPSQWSPVKNAGFYGKYIHSGHFIRTGRGDRKATWVTNISEPGQYEIFTFMTPQIGFGRRSRLEDYMGELHYVIHHYDGSEEIIIDGGQSEEGWNLLGIYYFPEGEAKVELSDESNKRLVIADAIKFVKR